MAFTTVELAVSLAIFFMLSTVIALTVARSLGATQQARTLRAAETATVDVLNQMSTISYDNLLAGTFTVPSPCPDVSRNSGIQGTSCVSIGGTTLTVGYSFQKINDATTNAVACADSAAVGPQHTAQALGYIGVCGHAVKLGGYSTSLPTSVFTRKINAPSAKYDPAGAVIRANLTGSYLAVPQQIVYLVHAGNPSAAVASASIDTDGIAVFTPPAPSASDHRDTCTSTDPCMLALNQGPSPAVNASTALFGPDARSAAGIVAAKGKIVNVSALVDVTTTLRVNLQALGNDVAAPPSVKGSVCLWAHFGDSGTRVDAPLCNKSQADAIVTSTYTDPASGTTLPLPPGSRIRLSVDSADGTCPSVPGQVSWDGAAVLGSAAAWRNAAACTSWTWGTPDNLPMSLTLGSGSTSAATVAALGRAETTVTWKPGPAGSPAAGWSDVSWSPWTHPRAVLGCSVDATCTGGSVPPEASQCPGQTCLDGQDSPPEIVTPAGGWVQAGSGSTDVTVTAADSDSSGVWLYLQSAPGTGTLTRSGSSLSDNALLASTSTGRRASTTITYTRPGGSTATVSITLRACPQASASPAGCTGGSSRTVKLTPSTPPGQIFIDPVTISQKSMGVLNVRVTTLDGQARTGAPVTLTLPAGITASPALATTDSAGLVTFTLSTGTTPAGTYQLTAVVDPAIGFSATADVTVLPAATSIVVNASSMTQNSTGALSVSVRDAANSSASGVAVAFTVTSSGTATADVYASPASCTTDSSGVCTVRLTADPGAPSGSYTVTATSGTVTGSAQFDITAAIGSITLTPAANLAPGAPAVDFVLTAADTSGAVLKGSALDLSGLSGLVVAPARLTTDGTGKATVHLSVPASTPSGTVTLQARYASKDVTAPVRVVSSPNSIQTSRVSVAQGSSSTIQVVVKDAGAGLVASTPVTFTSATTGLIVAHQGTTNAQGVAQATLTAERSVAAGSYTVQVSSGTVRADVVVEVTQTPTKAVLSGTVAQGSSGTLVLSVTDTVNQPIAGAEVNASVAQAGLSLDATTYTLSAKGQTGIVVSDSVGQTTGYYTMTITIGSWKTTARFIVSGAPAGITVTGPAAALVGAQSVYTMTVVDQTGHPIPGTSASVSPAVQPYGPYTNLTITGDGDDATALTRADGTLTFTIDVGPQAASGSRTVNVTVGRITTSHTLNIVSDITGVLLAQSGGLWPLDSDSATVTDLAGSHPGTWAAAYTNLATNPSLENGITGWSADNPSSISASVNQSTYQSVFGTASLAVTANASAASYTIRSPSTPAQAQFPYTASVYVRVNRAHQIAPCLNWRTASGAALSPTCRVATLSANTWTRLAVAGTAPDTATSFDLSLRHAPSSGDTVWVDGLLLEQSSRILAYFDGGNLQPGRGTGSPTPHWNGAEGLSTSSVTFTRPTLLPGAGTVQNLATNPSLEVSSQGWDVGTFGSTGTGTAILTTQAARYGSYGYRKTWTSPSGTSDATAFTYGATSPYHLPVTGGQTYTYSAWLRISATGPLQATVSYYDTAGALTGTGASDIVNATAGTWVRASVTSSAPAGTARAVVSFGPSITSGSLAAGTTLDVDGLLIEQNASPSDYFDGTVLDPGWSGALNPAWNAGAGTSSSTLAWKTSQGFMFDHASTLSIAQSTSPVVPATGSFTLYAWVRNNSDDPSTSPLAVSNSAIEASSGSLPAGLVIGAGGHGAYLQVGLSDGTTNITKPIVLTSSLQPSTWTGRWRHVAVGVDRQAKMITVWVDGTLAGSATWTENLGSIASSSPLLVGRSLGWRFDGTVDDIAITSGVNPDLIQSAYRAGRP